MIAVQKFWPYRNEQRERSVHVREDWLCLISHDGNDGTARADSHWYPTSPCRWLERLCGIEKASIRAFSIPHLQNRLALPSQSGAKLTGVTDATAAAGRGRQAGRALS